MPSMRRVLGLLLLLSAAAAGAAPVHARQDMPRSGTVEIDQTQVALIFSGAFGGGTLHFGGKSYPFKFGGLGIGGFGIAKLHATATP